MSPSEAASSSETELPEANLPQKLTQQEMFDMEIDMDDELRLLSASLCCALLRQGRLAKVKDEDAKHSSKSSWLPSLGYGSKWMGSLKSGEEEKLKREGKGGEGSKKKDEDEEWIEGFSLQLCQRFRVSKEQRNSVIAMSSCEMDIEHLSSYLQGLIRCLCLFLLLMFHFLTI